MVAGHVRENALFVRVRKEAKYRKATLMEFFKIRKFCLLKLFLIRMIQSLSGMVVQIFSSTTSPKAHSSIISLERSKIKI